VLSDPGALLVRTAHQQGIKVEPVPGPSAVAAIVSGAGTGADGFVFVGFPPGRSKARKNWLVTVATEPRPIILFEAPHRIRELLVDMKEILGDRLVAMGRELTKAHEELVVRPISEHLNALTSPRGEFTLLVHPSDSRSGSDTPMPTGPELLLEFGELTNLQRLGRREALQSLAARYKLPSRRVYSMIEEAKKFG
jgi:16S rRNA (cytidine1402-2'-O)-methyltransferase